MNTNALRRSAWAALALVLGTWTLRADTVEPAAKFKTGPAYEALGQLPLMHDGRVKPLDTLARFEVKLIHGRESLQFEDARGNTVATWGPVAAFYGWSVDPGYWDEQPFVLVEYLPLKQVLLSASVKARLAAIADDGSAAAATRKQAAELAKADGVTLADLRQIARDEKLNATNRKGLDELVDKLGEASKFFTPREIEEARIPVEGKTVSFLDWTNDLRARSQTGEGMAALRPEPLSNTEKRAIEVADRLLHYQHIRGDVERFLPPVDQVMPRPHSEAYIKYAGGVFRKVREIAESSDGHSRQSAYDALNLLEEDTANTVFRFLKTLQSKNRKEPGTDAEFDRDFAEWLREDADWMSLRVLLDVEPAVLAGAGFPAAKVEAFRTAYKALKEAETAEPGHAPAEKAQALVAAARDLGDDLGDYPSQKAMERESHFNVFAPFYRAPMLYGLGFLFLLFSMTIKARTGTALALLKTACYVLGMVGFVGGIGLEIYGFYCRVLISGWAPVTNMYETVIWVGGVSALLGLIFEGIYRRRYMALAGAGVAFLTTLIAASAGPAILDPNIKSIPPVLRSNYWLTIHVLTIVSSYAAFALAMGLGVVATLFYLTANYRRPVTLLENLYPFFLGAPIALIGWLGYTAAKDAGTASFFADPSVALIFGLISLVGIAAALAPVSGLIGEGISRLLLPESTSLDAASIAGESAATGAQAVRESGQVATAARPTIAQLRTMGPALPPKGDPRAESMQRTALIVKPLSGYIYRTMQVGVLLVAAGTILGGWWADKSWGRFWGWDAKEVWALITLLIYLVPLHGRFAGWINTWGLVAASVFCFGSVMMAWYGVNFVLGVGLHSYGFAEGGGQELVAVVMAAVFSLVVAAGWRRHRGLKATTA